METHAEIATAHYRTLLEIERAVRSTQNRPRYEKKRDKILVQYYRDRRAATGMNVFDSPDAELEAALAVLEKHGHVFPPSGPPDKKYEEELKIIAGVHAYFEIAFEVRTFFCV